MPLDPNIILQTKPIEMANPLDSAVKALTMSNLMQEHQGNTLKLNQEQRAAADQQTMRDAYKNNTTVAPDGTPVVDRQSMMSDLTKANPMLASQKAMEFKQMDIEKLNQQHATAKSILFGIDPSNQASLDDAFQKAKQFGLPPLDGVLPKSVNDPSFQSSLRSAQIKNLSAEEQLAQQNKGLELQNKKTELEIERYKTVGGMPPSMPGQGPSASGGKSGGMGGKASPTDPAELVRMKVPPAQQPKVFDEIGAAQNTAQNAPKILKAFDDASGKIHGVDFVPGIENADQKALHALLGPTFKDVEGTVRQAAMDNMNNNITPQFGDDKKTTETKRAALVAYLKSKSSAPAAKGFGIDLTKFPSTFIPDDVGKKASSAPPDGSLKDWGGKTYKLVGDQWVAQQKQAAK